MWLNFLFMILASLCVGFILGWIVARPRRWVAFGGDVPGTPDFPGTPGVPDDEDRTGVGSFARRA